MLFIPDPLPAIDHVQAFQSWLTSKKPDWSISGPYIAEEHTEKQRVVFELWYQDVPVGLYLWPLDALRRIGDEDLINQYLHIIADMT